MHPLPNSLAALAIATLIAVLPACDCDVEHRPGRVEADPVTDDHASAHSVLIRLSDDEALATTPNLRREVDREVRQLLAEADDGGDLCSEVVALYLTRFERLSAPSHRTLALQACPSQCVDALQAGVFLELLWRSAEEADSDGRIDDAVTYLEAMLTPSLLAAQSEEETDAIRARIWAGTRQTTLSNWRVRFDRKTKDEWISSGLLNATAERLQIRISVERGDCSPSPQPCDAALSQAQHQVRQNVASLAAAATELDRIPPAAVEGVTGEWLWVESQAGWDGVFEVALASLFDLVFDSTTQ